MTDQNPMTFLRHSEIEDRVCIKLTCLRDYFNRLKLLSKECHQQYLEAIQNPATRDSLLNYPTKDLFHRLPPEEKN